MLPPFLQELEEIKKAGLFRALKKLDPKVLNFCSNDYLGLAQDPRLIEAATQAMRRFGAGSGAARLISGNFALLEELEEALARFQGAESTLVFNSGYHANIGVLPAIAGEGDVIFSDELNHASLIDGCRLSKAETIIYRHNDLNHLEELLKKKKNSRSIIVTESVFSMEGDLCPVADLLVLADRYGALVYLDEAHAVGVFGENGEGRVPKGTWYLLVRMGTLGKAFGSYGAFVTGSAVIRDYLINRARSFIFTTAIPPTAVGASLKALQIIQEEPERRAKLWENIEFLKTNLAMEHNGSAIFSLRVGSPTRTMEISNQLLEKGIYVQGIRPPTVPEGTSRLRLTVTATHTEGQLKRLIEALSFYGFTRS